MIFFKLSYHLNQVFKKIDVLYHVSYTIPVQTINNGKIQVFKKSHEVKVSLLEVISTYDLLYILCNTIITIQL